MCHVRVAGRAGRVIVSPWIQVISPWLGQERVLRGTRLALDVGLSPLGVPRNTSRVFALDVSLFPLAGLLGGLVTGLQAYRKCIDYREI